MSPLTTCPSDDLETGVYAPLCLLIASLLLFFRTVLLELAFTVRINGSCVSSPSAPTHNSRHLPGTTSTFLQFSGNTLALIGQQQRLSHHSMPILASMLAVLFLVALGILTLAGIRENASATAAVFVLHARIARLLHVLES
jgi:uncharacterized membrane protein SirB2